MAAEPAGVGLHLRGQAHLRRRGVLEQVARGGNKLQAIRHQVVRERHLYDFILSEPKEKLQSRLHQVQLSPIPRSRKVLPADKREQEAGHRGIPDATEGTDDLAVAELHDTTSTQGHELEKPPDSKPQ